MIDKVKLNDGALLIPYDKYEEFMREFLAIEEEKEKETIEIIKDNVAPPTDEPIDYFSLFSDPALQINEENTIETFSLIERSILINEEIEPYTATYVFNFIRFWNTIDDMEDIPIEERKPIKIYIDSPGGDLDATFSIIDSIKLSKTPVYTITYGIGHSGGFFIGIAGHKRYGMPHSSYMFHEGCGQGGGDAHKYIQSVKFYEKRLSQLKKHTLENTKISEQSYNKHRKDDLWLTADEALEFGIIDEILTEFI